MTPVFSGGASLTEGVAFNVDFPDGPFNATQAYLWTKRNGLESLGSLGIDVSNALETNNLGQVAGQANTNDTSDGQVERHAFFWSAENGMVDLGTLSGSESTPYAMNDAGQVVGIADSAEGQARVFLDSGNWYDRPRDAWR